MAPLWVDHLTGSDADFNGSVVGCLDYFDQQYTNDMFVAGTMVESSTLSYMAVAKYSSTGVLLATGTYPPLPLPSEQETHYVATAMAVEHDPFGNDYVVSYDPSPDIGGSDKDLVVQWAATYNGPASGNTDGPGTGTDWTTAVWEIPPP